jgi:glutamate racemase
MTAVVPPSSPHSAPLGGSIGVFDSGVGGLSVLQALHRRLPGVRLAYLADSGHAPYGERDVGFVVDRSRRIVEHLLADGATGIVVACNTATAAAVRALRERWPDVPIVGVEPGLKPAAAATRNGKVGVMATGGTLASDRYAALLRQQPPHVRFIAQPCPGLARLIEDGDLDAPALVDAVARHAAPLKDAGVDTVVLGCTHYGFVKHHLAGFFGADVHIVDTADAVARHAATRMSTPHEGSGEVRLQTTGDVARLRRIASAWLPFACSVEGIAADSPAA